MAELSPQEREALLRALIAGGQDGLANPSAALQALLHQSGGILGGGFNAAQIIAGLKEKLQLSNPALARAAGAGAAAMAGVEPNPIRQGRDRREDDGLSGILTSPPKPKTDDFKPKPVPTTQETAPAPDSKPQGILPMGPSQGPDPGTAQVPDIPDVPSSVNRAVARGDAADRIRSWHSFLTKPVNQGGLGRTSAQATGEIASLLGESAGLNPNLSHDPHNGKPTGYGTAGWRDPPGATTGLRRTNLMNFAKSIGEDYRAMEAQQKFYRHEMLGGEPGAVKANARISAAQTPQEAMAAHIRYFERPKYPDKEVNNRAKHFTAVAGAIGGQREVATGSDSMGRGATAGPGLAPALKPPPAPTQRAAPQPTGILGGPRNEVQAPTSPTFPTFQAATHRPIKALVIHHTAPRNEAGDVPQTVDDIKGMYANRGLKGAHLFMDRQGNVMQTLPFDQAGQHIRTGQGPGAGLSNANTIGIEVAAKDDSDITPEQRESMKRLWPEIQRIQPGIQVFGHGEINPHKQHTEGSTIVGDLRALGQTLPKAGEDVPLPPARPADIGTATPDVATTGSIPDAAAEPAPTVAPDATAAAAPDAGVPDLSGFALSAAAPAPAPTPEPEAEKGQASELLASPGLLQGGGILSQPNPDLGRVFSPEGFGGSGLLGRDQAPETTGFKAPVGLPQGGQIVGPTGILGGIGVDLADAPLPPRRSAGIEGVLSPPRPAGIGETPAIAPPQLPTPQIETPALAQTSPLITRNQDLPGYGTPGGQGRDFGTPDVGTRPSLGGAGILMPSPAAPRPTDALSPAPIPPPRPSGILGAPAQPAPQLAAVASPPPLDPDRFARDATPSAPMTVNVPGRQAAAALASSTSLAGSATPGQQPDLSRLAGILSSGFGGTSGGFGSASSEAAAQGKRRAATRAQGSSPALATGSLLQRGILANAMGGVDLNRFFGILGGRAF